MARPARAASPNSLCPTCPRSVAPWERGDGCDKACYVSGLTLVGVPQDLAVVAERMARRPMTTASTLRPRTVLPIPDRPNVGPITYDAKDPDTSFPDIEPLRPPVGAPSVSNHPARRCGFRRVLDVRGSVRDADRRPPVRAGAALPALPHDRAVLADPSRAAQRAQPPSTWMRSRRTTWWTRRTGCG